MFAALRSSPFAVCLRPLIAVLLALQMAVAFTAPAVAVEPDEILADHALEARARAISSGLRCLVCQNQSIDDSNAPLAKDLRLLVRDRLKAGDTDAEVVAYIVDRYGAFVLLKPPLTWSTLLLWLSPLLIVVAAGLLLYRQARRPAALPGPAALTAEEQARLERLLKPTDVGS